MIFNTNWVKNFELFTDFFESTGFMENLLVFFNVAGRWKFTFLACVSA